MNTSTNTKTKIVIALAVIAIISRIIPHAYNFSPFGAMALFGAAYLDNRKWAYALPVIAAWISGVILNNTIYASIHPNFILFDKDIIWQSLSYITIVFVGEQLLKSHINPIRVITGAFSASLLFYIITNFGFWTTGLIYPTTSIGLVSCYTAALPFFQSTLIGDLLFSGLFFGSFALINRRVSHWQHAQ